MRRALFIFISLWPLFAQGNKERFTEDLCSSNPCLNGGICYNQTISSYGCDCNGTGYTGLNCETRIVCSAITVAENSITWPMANSLTEVQGICVKGFIGSPTRECDADGNFGPVNGSCNQAYCPAEYYYYINWPKTMSRNYAYVECPTGWTGTVIRRCDTNGTWFLTVNGTCTRVVCPTETDSDDITWTQAFYGEIRHGACPTGYGGAPYRYCLANGTFGPVLGTPCTQCPAETYGHANWSASLPLTLVTGACLPGYVGTPTRICKWMGVWETFLPTMCSQIQCSADVIGNASFPNVAAGEKIFGKCIGGTTGRPVKI